MTGVRRGRLGLRARVTASFAVGAACLSGALAAVTYTLAAHYLLAQRQTSAMNQGYADARLVKEDLAGTATNVADVLSSLTPAEGTRSLLHRNGRWFSTSVSVGHTVLPPALVRAVEGGSVARQRILVDGTPSLAIGVPLPAVGAQYFEVRSLAELSRTLDVLAAILAAAGVATTLGGGLLGRLSSRRLIRPLTEMSGFAAAVGRGALDRRLPVAEDPDLDPLVTSFNAMVDALHQRIERDARFASDVSHELRSPLTTVQTSVDLLGLFRQNLPAEGHKALDLLSSEISRFSDMVTDLLEISRLDAGAATMDVEDLPLDELVTRTVAAHTSGTVPVRVAAAATGMMVRADRRRLQRVLANLIDNATVHAGGATLVGVDCDGTRAFITVDDAGPGVPPPERDRIFERFYRGHAAGQRSGTAGTGLGLALAAEHVKAHRGRLHVTDRPGGGARFVVELPLVGQ